MPLAQMEESLHPRTLSSEEHVEAAVSSLVDTLGDSYSVYASPEQLRRPRTGIQYGLQFESRSGKQIGERGSVLQKEVVRAVLPDSSAEAAGLRIGDVILPLSAPTGTGRSEGDPRAAAGARPCVPLLGSSSSQDRRLSHPHLPICPRIGNVAQVELYFKRMRRLERDRKSAWSLEMLCNRRCDACPRVCAKDPFECSQHRSG